MIFFEIINMSCNCIANNYDLALIYIVTIVVIIFIYFIYYYQTSYRYYQREHYTNSNDSSKQGFVFTSETNYDPFTIQQQLYWKQRFLELSTLSLNLLHNDNNNLPKYEQLPLLTSEYPKEIQLTIIQHFNLKNVNQVYLIQFHLIYAYLSPYDTFSITKQIIPITLRLNNQITTIPITPIHNMIRPLSCLIINESTNSSSDLLHIQSIICTLSEKNRMDYYYLLFPSHYGITYRNYRNYKNTIPLKEMIPLRSNYSYEFIKQNELLTKSPNQLTSFMVQIIFHEDKINLLNNAKFVFISSPNIDTILTSSQLDNQSLYYYEYICKEPRNVMNFVVTLMYDADIDNIYMFNYHNSPFLILSYNIYSLCSPIILNPYDIKANSLLIDYQQYKNYAVTLSKENNRNYSTILPNQYIHLNNIPKSLIYNIPNSIGYTNKTVIYENIVNQSIIYHQSIYLFGIISINDFIPTTGNWQNNITIYQKEVQTINQTLSIEMNITKTKVLLRYRIIQLHEKKEVITHFDNLYESTFHKNLEEDCYYFWSFGLNQQQWNWNFFPLLYASNTNQLIMNQLKQYQLKNLPTIISNFVNQPQLSYQLQFNQTGNLITDIHNITFPDINHLCYLYYYYNLQMVIYHQPINETIAISNIIDHLIPTSLTIMHSNFTFTFIMKIENLYRLVLETLKENTTTEVKNISIPLLTFYNNQNQIIFLLQLIIPSSLYDMYEIKLSTNLLEISIINSNTINNLNFPYLQLGIAQLHRLLQISMKDNIDSNQMIYSDKIPDIIPFDSRHTKYSYHSKINEFIIFNRFLPIHFVMEKFRYRHDQINMDQNFISPIYHIL